EEIAIRRGREGVVGDLEIGPQGLQLFPARLPVGLPGEDLLELDELPESPHGVEVHLDSLEPVDLAGLADLGFHREDAGQDLADRRCVRDRCKEDPTLLHAADVGPLVVDELTSLAPSIDRSLQRRSPRLKYVSTWRAVATCSA